MRLGERRIGVLRRREQAPAARRGSQRPLATGRVRLGVELGERDPRIAFQSGADLAFDQVARPLDVVRLVDPALLGDVACRWVIATSG